MDVDLVILGAGPAGLAAAVGAAERNLSVVVLERASRSGGMAASFTISGQRVDLGSHRLHPVMTHRVEALVRDAVGDNLQERVRNGRMYFAGRAVSFPLRLSELLWRLPRPTVARLASDVLLSPVRRRPSERSFADVVRNRFGSTMLQAFYGPYARKIWGCDPELLAAEQAYRRIGVRDSKSLVRKAMGSGRRNTFLYPRGGFGTVVDGLHTRAETAGVQLRMEAEVTNLQVAADSVTASLANGATLRGQWCFSTIPQAGLARIALGRGDDLAHRAMVLLYVTHGGSQWTSFDAHYFADAACDATRISEPKNYRDSADDPPDTSVLCCEFPCEQHDEIWEASPSMLVDRLRAQLAAIGLPVWNVEGTQIVRLPTAYPIVTPASHQLALTMSAELSRLPRVVSFGRLGLFAHDNTHHALEMGLSAAARLERRGEELRFDAVGWRRDRKRFARHIVED